MRNSICLFSPSPNEAAAKKLSHLRDETEQCDKRRYKGRSSHYDPAKIGNVRLKSLESADFNFN
jgi:hypothetical protein